MAEIEGLAGLIRRLDAIGSPAAGEQMMKLVGTLAVREAKILEAPHRKTGVTGASIHLSVVTPTSATIAAGGAARFLEDGTRPHEITPKVAKVLAWPKAGNARLTGSARKGTPASGMVFAARVHHPGTRPYPFMVPGAQNAVRKAQLANVIIERWNAAD